MDPVQRFGAYAAAFEEAYKTDDWSVLDPYFTEDAVYDVIAEAPFGETHEGRAAVLAGFKNSLDNFDRRFDTRSMEALEGPRVEDGTVFMRWRVTYGREGAPDFVLEGEERAWFEGDRIKRLEDRMPSLAEKGLPYFGEHEAKLKPVGG